jgi:hypothetical protein
MAKPGVKSSASRVETKLLCALHYFKPQPPGSRFLFRITIENGDIGINRFSISLPPCESLKEMAMLRTINGTLRQTNFTERMNWYRSGISSISREKVEDNFMRNWNIRRLHSGLKAVAARD